ncbi:MAG: septation ring formation regulator EzrA [Tenericutes bacterium]|nr:septation ring formation regulator EzrA [Mycoplasmatota bacterium]
MDKITIIITGIFVFCIILIYILTIIIKNKKKKEILFNVDRLTTEKNLIISSSLITELSKANKLINNKKIASEVEEWKKRFDDIEKNDMPKLTDKLIEVENYILEKNYAEAHRSLNKAEKSIFYVKAKSIKLLNEIKELTESEERNREAITKLKSIYREVVFKYNKNKNDYMDVSSRIELQFENIDKLFSAFEVAVQNSEYDELGKIVKALDDMIHNISIVIEEAPTIAMMATMVLPKKMKDIKSLATKMTREGYNLEYLNIDYNIEETNKKIAEIMDRLYVLNLQDSIFDLKTLLDYYETLYSDFDAEKRGKKEYERGLINISERISKVSSIIRNLYSEIDNIKDTYDLSDDEIKVIDEINKDLIAVKDSFKLVKDRTLIKVMPYSKLSSEIEMVAVNLSKVEDKLESTLKNLGSLKEDEARARDQLSEIKAIINNSKYKIKDYNLPVIPDKFYIELKEAHDAIKEIVKEIDKKPISIKTLNLRVDTARDLSLKLYQTADSLVNTAAMAEMAIVYGNRYRSSNTEVEMGLISASKSFYKGDYKNSLEIVLNTLNIVEPGIHKKLLSKMEKEV